MIKLAKIIPTVGIATVLGLFCVTGLVGCEKEQGPLEKAGENMDEALNDAGRAIEDATD